MGLSQSLTAKRRGFLIAFLSVLCALCGKKPLPRFMADWRILSRQGVADYGGICRVVNIMA